MKPHTHAHTHTPPDSVGEIVVVCVLSALVFSGLWPCVCHKMNHWLQFTADVKLNSFLQQFVQSHWVIYSMTHTRAWISSPSSNCVSHCHSIGLILKHQGCDVTQTRTCIHTDTHRHTQTHTLLFKSGNISYSHRTDIFPALVHNRKSCSQICCDQIILEC